MKAKISGWIPALALLSAELVAGLSATPALADPGMNPDTAQKICVDNPPIVADPAVWLADPIKMMMAGDETGVPADSPLNRVDPNTPGSPWAGVCHLTFGGIARCTGVPISRFQILSAGHCADLDDNGTNDIGTNVLIQFNDTGAGSTIIGAGAIASVTIDPDFTGFNNPTVNDDLVLITLNQPLPTSIPIYPVFTGVVSGGQAVTLVGYGRSGFGDVGAMILGDANTKRVGMNRADQFFQNDEGGATLEVFQYDFDGPNNGTNCFGGATLGNDIETSVAPGDSGGPSFLAVNGRIHTWGINTFSGNCIGPSTLFGSIGGGILVSGSLPWLVQFLPPSPFALLTPADAATGAALEPLLDWEKADFAGTYTVTIALDQALTNIVFQQAGVNANFTSLQTPAGVLQPGVTYFWSVTAVNTHGATVSDGGAFSFTTATPADINGDGLVNGADLAFVLSAWGATGPNAADVNGDGIVNGADLAFVLSAWTG